MLAQTVYRKPRSMTTSRNQSELKSQHPFYVALAKARRAKRDKLKKVVKEYFALQCFRVNQNALWKIILTTIVVTTFWLGAAKPTCAAMEPIPIYEASCPTAGPAFAACFITTATILHELNADKPFGSKGELVKLANKTIQELENAIYGPEEHHRVLALLVEAKPSVQHIATTLKNGGLEITDFHISLYPLPNNRTYFGYQRDINNGSRHRKFRTTAHIKFLDARGNVIATLADRKWYTSCESKRDNQLYEAMLDLNVSRIKYIRIDVPNYRRSDC